MAQSDLYLSNGYLETVSKQKLIVLLLCFRESVTMAHSCQFGYVLPIETYDIILANQISIRFSLRDLDKQDSIG